MLSPPPSFESSGPLWSCLLPQAGSESAKGPFFPPWQDPSEPPDLLDPLDCASSVFSQPPSPYNKDSEPSSDDLYLISSMTASMELRSRLGSTKARVIQHGNGGVQSCVLTNVPASPVILVKLLSINWSKVLEKSNLYMKLEPIVSVYRVHLAQSHGVVLNPRPLFVQISQVSRVCSTSTLVTITIRFQDPSILLISAKSKTIRLSMSFEIHLVSLESLVGARAILACSASFQTLPFGLINVDSDYFRLVVVTYSGIHLKISHGSPVVELVISCYVVLLYDVSSDRRGSLRLLSWLWM
ncbi:hypothetical protein HID58_069157 [Brassica napus]|uniref:Uncharacterized protein n=1 Tax=Brassica napus TaxID=3708 RepID=A0ABQ7XHF7_BRANA|nr:hypothetical protein HID58_069157 [Brassica napus]